MKEYISKEQVKAALARIKELMGSPNPDYETMMMWEIEDLVDTLPPADVKPVVRGANIATEYAECDQFICSKCGIHL